jgi:hypothetical protein
VQAPGRLGRRNRAHFFTSPLSYVRRQGSRHLVTGHKTTWQLGSESLADGKRLTALSDLECYVTLVTQMGSSG